MDIPRPTILDYSGSSPVFNQYGQLTASSRLRHDRVYRTPRNETPQDGSFLSNTSSGNFAELFGNIQSHENTFREIFGVDCQAATLISADSQHAVYQSSQSIVSLLPVDVLNNIVSHVTDQNDLVSLSSTCSLFNALVTPALYEKIQIVDSDVVVNHEKTKHYLNNEYTFLKVSKLKLLVRSIINDFNLLNNCISEIIILTNSDKPFFKALLGDKDDSDSPNSNPYEILYDLVSKSNNNSLTLLNFDFTNLQTFGNYLTFVKNKFFQNNRVNLYEQFNSTPSSASAVAETLSPSIANKFTKHLLFYQLSDLSDLNILPLSIGKLSFYSNYGKNYNPVKEFRPNYNGLRALYNLNSLYLNSSQITNEFFSKVAPIFQQDSLEKVHLKTLSITYSHFFNESLLRFYDVASIFDLSYLQHLEIKAKCVGRNDCDNNCFVEFFQGWDFYDELTDGDPSVHLQDNSSITSREDTNDYHIDTALAGHNYTTSNQMYSLNPLAASSYCYFPSNSSVSVAAGHKHATHHQQVNKNFSNIEKLSIVNNHHYPLSLRTFMAQNQYENFVVNYLKHFVNLKFLFLNLRDFVDITASSNNNDNEQVNEDLVYRKVSFKKSRIVMFKEILTLKKLKSLIITDFFQNWSIYLDNNYNMHQLNYVKPLNACDCSSCRKGRAAIQAYSLLFHNNTDGGIEKIQDTEPNFLNEASATQYCPFYFEVLAQLNKRLPFSAYAKNMTSGLDVLKYPINADSEGFVYDCIPPSMTSNTDAVSQFKLHFRENMKLVVGLIIHAVRPELKPLVKGLPHLDTLVLGGIYFHVEHLADKRVKVKAIYDSYEEIF